MADNPEPFDSNIALYVAGNLDKADYDRITKGLETGLPSIIGSDPVILSILGRGIFSSTTTNDDTRAYYFGEAGLVFVCAKYSGVLTIPGETRPPQEREFFDASVRLTMLSPPAKSDLESAVSALAQELGMQREEKAKIYSI